MNMIIIMIFFFQAEDGIRDAQESRGLGDVYKRQVYMLSKYRTSWPFVGASFSKDLEYG